MNTKKELAQSVQPFTCDAVTKGKRDSFIYIYLYIDYVGSVKFLVTEKGLTPQSYSFW